MKPLLFIKYSFYIKGIGQECLLLHANFIFSINIFRCGHVAQITCKIFVPIV